MASSTLGYMYEVEVPPYSVVCDSPDSTNGAPAIERNLVEQSKVFMVSVDGQGRVHFPGKFPVGVHASALLSSHPHGIIRSLDLSPTRTRYSDVLNNLAKMPIQNPMQLVEE
jgi:hypothetical protein